MNNYKDTLSSCVLCPNECRINRLVTRSKICKVGKHIQISSYGPHFGEEPELVGFGGSGTIFFTGCNLLCVFCQNYDISHFSNGLEISVERLSEIMISLQSSGCTNINLVTPTHFTLQIIESIKLAKIYGLKIPIVWNSNAYEKVDTLKLLDGFIDIYMPDLKFISAEKSKTYTIAKNYFEFASRAIAEMHRQVGDLIVKNGRAKRGLLIRHLVLPHNQSDTKGVIDFVAEHFGTNTYLNLMSQYYPYYKAQLYPLIKEPIAYSEYISYLVYARRKGFSRPSYLYEEIEP